MTTTWLLFFRAMASQALESFSAVSALIEM
jgi:hypothetical protein